MLRRMAGTQSSQTQPSAKSEAPEPEPVRYTAADLQEHAVHLLDSTPMIVSGALYGQSLQSFTIEQAKDLLKKFVSKEV